MRFRLRVGDKTGHRRRACLTRHVLNAPEVDPPPEEPDPEHGAVQHGAAQRGAAHHGAAHHAAPGTEPDARGLPLSPEDVSPEDLRDAEDLAQMEDAATAIRVAEAAQLTMLGRVMHRTFGHAAGGSQTPIADRGTAATTARPAARRRSPELEHRSLRLEVSARLQVSEHAAEKLMLAAHQAHDIYVATLGALASGEIPMQSVHVVVDEGLVFHSLPEHEATSRRARFEAEILPHARTETPNRLRPIAHRIALHLADLPFEEQHQEAARRRCLQVRELPDGMAEFSAYLPAMAAYGIRDRIAQIARQLASEPAEDRSEHGANQTERRTESQTEHQANRTQSQIEADLFTDLLLTGEVPVSGDSSTPLGRGIAAHVQVIVPEHQLAEGTIRPRGITITRASSRAGGTLSGHDQAGKVMAGDASVGSASTGRAPVGSAPVGGVPELVGYGPVSAGVARSAANLATSEGGSWDVVKVDLGGTVLSVDRYRPSAEMRRFIAARDLHCRAPGCRRQAARCDIDHTIAAEDGGSTSTDNLAVLCRGHHIVKHHTQWSLEQRDGGVLVWTSPTSRRHPSQPPSRVRFRAR